MMLIDIFKTSIAAHDLSLNLDNLKNYSYRLASTEKTRNRSNVGGYQSNPINKTDPELKELVDKIVLYGTEYAKLIGLKENAKLEFANGWFNINGYKDHNIAHVHLDSIISGVFYIEVPKESGNIKFYNENEIIQYFIPDKLIENFNSYNSSAWILPAIPNRLYLFPAWLKHMAESNLNENSLRISFAFDLDILQKS
jgi:uncharacterized protein (TIGR02466 family)